MIFEIQIVIGTTFLVKFYTNRAKASNFGRHFDADRVTAQPTEHAYSSNKEPTWRKRWRIWLVLNQTPLKFVPFYLFFALIQKINYFTDKATDPSKSTDAVDYMTPVCDRINLDLDGWEQLIYNFLCPYYIDSQSKLVFVIVSSLVQ